jgi:hypothetical protein
VTDLKGNINKISFFARKPKHDNTIGKDGKPVKFDMDRMNAFVENTKDFVMVQYYVFGKMMPPAEYFSKKATTPEAKPKS